MDRAEDRRCLVLLVADDPLDRAGLAMTLAQESSLSVVGQIAPREDVAGEARTAGASVILWDSGADYADDLERMRELAPLPAPIVALVAGERSLTESYAAGVRGLLLRAGDPA